MRPEADRLGVRVGELDDAISRARKHKPKCTHPPDQEERRPPEFTDEALALQFAHEHESELRYVAAWGKWFLLVGAADAQQMAMIAVLLVSSLLNVAYLVPVAARGFFRNRSGDEDSGHAAIREAPLFCVVPLSMTAVGCVLLFFYADALYTLLLPIAAPETTP